MIIDIDDIDYPGLIRLLLPYVKKADIPLPEKVIDAAAAPGVLENFLKFIPRSKQDEIVMSIVNKNNARIIKRGEALAERLGADMDISGIKLIPRESDTPTADNNAQNKDKED